MKILMLMVGFCLVLVVCVIIGWFSSIEKLDLYCVYVGVLQNDMQFFGSFNGWIELGDSVLVVWICFSEVYLLELNGFCQDLLYVIVIGLISQMNCVLVCFDKVLVCDFIGGLCLLCFINSICKLDVKVLCVFEQEL